MLSYTNEDSGLSTQMRGWDTPRWITEAVTTASDVRLETHHRQMAEAIAWSNRLNGSTIAVSRKNLDAFFFLKGLVTPFFKSVHDNDQLSLLFSATISLFLSVTFWSRLWRWFPVFR